MSAKVLSSGKVVQLDGRAQPDVLVTPEDAKDPVRLARFIARLLADVAALKRTFAPPFVDYEDQAVSNGGALIRLRHSLNARVRWWVVGWKGAAGYQLAEDTTTDANTLVLASYVAGTATIRVESAG